MDSTTCLVWKGLDISYTCSLGFLELVRLCSVIILSVSHHLACLGR
jgi:hypothetical protein